LALILEPVKSIKAEFDIFFYVFDAFAIPPIEDLARL